MIEKLEKHIIGENAPGMVSLMVAPTAEQQVDKINELVDAVNKLQKDYDNVCIWVGEQKLNYNPDTTKGLSTLVEEPTDPYAEQRKWIGCLVRYKICDWQGGWCVGVLDEIVDHPIYPFKMRNGDTAAVCEVVEPSEIYPNKARTW